MLTGRSREVLLVIVAGHIIVDPSMRDDYLSGCIDVVRQACASAGCLDFALSADLLDAGRINILERWESQDAVEAFRGSGVDGEQGRVAWRHRARVAIPRMDVTSS